MNHNKYHLKEIAWELKVSVKKLRKMVAAKFLPQFRVDPWNKRKFYTKEDLDKCKTLI